MRFSTTATGVGSVPHLEVARACEEVLAACPNGPYWPTFPGIDPRENMYAQCSEGLPRVRLDEERRTVVFDCEGDLTNDLAAFYERVLAEDVDSFACSESYARGLHFMVDALSSNNAGREFVKGQITGPFSFGLTVTDTSNRPILFDDQMADAVIQGLAMKARWQVRKLAETRLPVVVFVDEPYFASLGSAYVPIGRDEAVPMLRTVVSAIQQEGGLVGIHCCGNTDWSAVIETGVDIVNFDAYAYFEGLSLYTGQLAEFLTRGGALAWGMVPTDENVNHDTLATLLVRMDHCIASLTAKGIPESLVRESMIITPSCGLGTLNVESARKAMRLATDLAEAAKPASGVCVGG